MDENFQTIQLTNDISRIPTVITTSQSEPVGNYTPSTIITTQNIQPTSTIIASQPSTVISTPEQPINVYHVKQSEYTIGWIILCLILGLIIIGFIVLVTFNFLNLNGTTPCSCFGTFGIESGVDANPLNLCGTNGITPCSFNINNLSDAITQCNNLQSICQAFTFNPSISTMKIVTPSNTFSSPQSTLYVRQSAQISG